MIKVRIVRSINCVMSIVTIVTRFLSMEVSFPCLKRVNVHVVNAFLFNVSKIFLRYLRIQQIFNTINNSMCLIQWEKSIIIN